MSPALRRLMAAAEGAGELEGAGVVRGRAEHPVCGDVVELTVRLVAGCIEELAWRASGCPATLAVCAAAATSLAGAPLGEARARLRARLHELGGLDAHEGHAERILLDALRRAGGAAPA